MPPPVPIRAVALEWPAISRPYHPWLSPFSRKVRVALREKNLDFDLKVEKVWERRPGFLAINPAGQVPVLIEPDGDSIERIKQARKAAAETGVEDPTFEEALSKSGEGEDAEGQSADKTAASSGTSRAKSGEQKAG